MTKNVIAVDVGYGNTKAVCIPLHTSPPPPKLQPIRVSTQGDGSGAGR